LIGGTDALSKQFQQVLVVSRMVGYAPAARCAPVALIDRGASARKYKSIASSKESVGDIRFRQFAKCMIQGDFGDVEDAESVGFSHGQFGLVV